MTTTTTTTTTTTNGTNGAQNVAAPKITLYTNHMCPYAHRAHITLEELGLPYEEVLIDLTTPRPQWYLDINPRGLVPSIKYTVPGIYDEEILTESAIVAQFLVDSFPGHLMPASRGGEPDAPLQRARIGFFVDTWNSKIGSQYAALLFAPTASEKETKISSLLSALEAEIEPLLATTSAERPFFGGSEHLTFAEVMAAPFVLRWYSLARDGEVIPASLAEKLDALPKFGVWARAVTAHPSVRKVYPEEAAVAGTKRKPASMQAGKK
ncbi:hypothetical protein DOTSEDRAFT_42958 [Lecanosticta acicola]|uniref:Thioredoxin-like protein n=1 Tax=Lecanosticta acicola TaxID=111012 RepID=A0AAI8YPB4_9PEZI|nr:hypothetical protein DOTSEDRAFT_42958 [Lecanosticta acicola]